MGDRTNVFLSIPACFENEFRKIDYRDYDEKKEINSVSLLVYKYQEVNYGELHFLETLRTLGIPYDSEWDWGNEYGSGVENFRIFPNGGEELKVVYDEEKMFGVTELTPFLSLPDELKKLIQKKDEKTKPLPWTGQELARSFWLTHKLINQAV